jgi:3-dehydroquinate dehydratase II
VRVAVVHGPNLNRLGERQPEIYGRLTLAEIDAELSTQALRLGVELESHQANGEGALIDIVQDAGGRVDGFVINAGGYTHTSVALLDALLATSLPFVEVHLSNIHGREPFRRESLLAPRAAGIVMGFGPASYLLGLQGLVERLRATVPGRMPIAGDAV